MTIVQSTSLEMAVCTVVFGGLAAWTYRRRSKLPAFVPVGFCLAFGFFALFFMLGVRAFLPIPLVMLGAAAGCSLLDMPSRWARSCIVVLALAMDLGYVAWFESIHGQLEAWKQRYPIVSLTDRLDYEKDLRVPINSDWNRPRFVSDDIKLQGISPFELSIENEALEHRLETQDRTFRSLYALHHDIDEQFSRALGFGVYRGRFLSYRHWKIDLPEHPLISFPQGRPLANLYGVSEGTRGVDFRPWHNQNILDFANPRSLGYVQRSETKIDTIGFVPHGLSTQPVPPATSGDAYQPWRITTLSLVSLLKHRPGAVYVSDHLPNMQELTSVPTRELDAFEQRSLEKLRDGEELAVEGGSAEIRMLGAIRAAYQCQDCHQVKRGSLLGAFTYQLVRTNREQPEAADLAGKGSSQ